MTSSVGQIRDLSLFDHRRNELDICDNHVEEAQAAIATTIDDLYQSNTTFRDLFQGVLSKSGRAPITFSVTHDAISINLSGKTRTLEFADLGKTHDSKDIRAKSLKLLKTINTIYTRCLNEDDDTSTRPLHRSRVRPLSASSHSSRSSGSRRSSRVSESTVESEAEEPRSRRPAKSPYSSRPSSSRRSSTESRKTVDPMPEEESSSRSSHLSTRTAPSKSRYAPVCYPVRKAKRAEKSGTSLEVRRIGAALRPKARTSGTDGDTATRAFKALKAERNTTNKAFKALRAEGAAARRAFDALRAEHATTVSNLATTSAERDGAISARDSALSSLAAERVTFAGSLAKVTEERDVAKRALETSRADLTSYEQRLRERDQKIEQINDFFAAARQDNPRAIVDYNDFQAGLQIANSIEHPSADNPIVITPEFFDKLSVPAQRLISFYMYNVMKKKPGYQEPASESERWEIGNKSFCDYQAGYVGTNLSPQELNKARADAIRYFVIESIAHDFETSVLWNTATGEPDRQLLDLYEKLPADMRHGIEGQLW